jgi:hypothetical protein
MRRRRHDRRCTRGHDKFGRYLIPITRGRTRIAATLDAAGHAIATRGR